MTGSDWIILLLPVVFSAIVGMCELDKKRIWCLLIFTHEGKTIVKKRRMFKKQTAELAYLKAFDDYPYNQIVLAKNSFVIKLWAPGYPGIQTYLDNYNKKRGIYV